MIGNVNQPSTNQIMDVDGTLKAGAVDVAAVLANSVVETAKIADAAVTAAKLAPDALAAIESAMQAQIDALAAEVYGAEPFEDIFATGLSHRWTAPTWTAGNNIATNAPTLGNEILADGGLEAAYTNGKCNSLTKLGSPTLVETSDAHGGLKAQQFTATASLDALFWPVISGQPKTWYLMSVHGKCINDAGNDVSVVLNSSNALPEAAPFRDIDTSDYKHYQIPLLVNQAGNLLAYAAYQHVSSPPDTIAVDDGSVRQISLADMFATVNGGYGDKFVRGTISISNGIVGIVSKLDNPAAPQNLVMAFLYRYRNLLKWSWLKCVDGNWSSIQSPANILTYAPAYVAEQVLELRWSGDSCALYYNGTQLGTTATIADAGITNNLHHGIVAVGDDVQVSRFYCGNGATELRNTFAGSSISVDYNITGSLTIFAYRGSTQKWLERNYIGRIVRQTCYAANGKNSWYALFMLQGYISTEASDLFVIDTANDGDTEKDKSALEAVIRRVWIARPTAKIVVVAVPTVDDPNDDSDIATPANATTLASVAAICQHYNLPMIDVRAEFARLVGLGTPLNTLMADIVHWTADGNAAAWALLEAELENGISAAHGALPGWLNNSDYDAARTLRYGSDNDGETGTWITIGGTTRRSSSAGATITFTTNCFAFGINQNGGTGVWKYSVNGGAYSSNITGTYNNGLAMPARDEYTITIQVVSGTVDVAEFWAI